MQQPALAHDIEQLVPGIAAAYSSLRTPDNRGLYTSTGRFYNHTLFGRDSSTAARFTGRFDHSVAYETILALAETQGHRRNNRTQEAPGRIVHEDRNFHRWQGVFSERLLLRAASLAWGGGWGHFRTYFAGDTTASYIRLIHMYASDIDAAILRQTVKDHYAQRRTIASSLALAADWVLGTVDAKGIVRTVRSNGLSLPYQAYQDSVSAYAFQNGSSANFTGPMAYIEVQAMSVDALSYAAELLPDHPRATLWRRSSERVARATMEHFWLPDQGWFASALDMAPGGTWRQLDSLNISALWTLDSQLYHLLGDGDRQRYIVPMIERAFSSEFLTPVGLRTRSIQQRQPLGNTIDYHGTTTVWPMFGYMVARGLRRHHMVGLAEQLETRLLNGVNLDGHFGEFSIVLEDGRVVTAPHSRKRVLPAAQSRGIQMMPEQHIAFTIVPCMAMAHDIASHPSRPTPRAWQAELEARLLPTIAPAWLTTDHHDLRANIPHTAAIGLNRQRGLARTVGYMLREGVRRR